MTPTPANDNVQRPAEYDAKIVAYRPFMRKLASLRGVQSADMEEFIQDVMVEAFIRYKHYRPDTYKLTTWIIMLVRNVYHRRRLYAQAGGRRGVTVDIEDVTLAVEPDQETLVDLAIAMDALPKDRDGEIWLRRAQGEELAEIGRDFGISRERARQLAARGRQRMERKLAIGAMVRHVKEAA